MDLSRQEIDLIEGCLRITVAWKESCSVFDRSFDGSNIFNGGLFKKSGLFGRGVVAFSMSLLGRRIFFSLQLLKN